MPLHHAEQVQEAEIRPHSAEAWHDSSVQTIPENSLVKITRGEVHLQPTPMQILIWRLCARHSSFHEGKSLIR
jgi:hypothetical protein